MIARFLLVLCVVRACSGAHYLSGKVYAFNEAGSYLSFNSVPAMYYTTLCLRFFSDLNRSFVLFSSASSLVRNMALLKTSAGEIEFWVKDKRIVFPGLVADLNEWNSVCVTWQYNTRKVQAWLNGKRSLTKFSDYKSQLPKASLSYLGQVQTAFGFDTELEFIGEINDLHLWNSVLPACDIEKFMFDKLSKSGNIINWRSLTYYQCVKVVQEEKQSNFS